MKNEKDLPTFELIYVIVNDHMGSRVLQKAKAAGISGGTVLRGRGTVNNRLLQFFSLYDEKKEIVLMGADQQTADRVLTKLNKGFHFDKPNHGIAFTIDLCTIIGSRCTCQENEEKRGVNKDMYQIIITIVNRGRAEDVIEAATAAGSKGGTIINARGSGINETSTLFNMAIEPEKEMVMILSKKSVTDKIIASIREKLAIDEPGNGIIFIQDTTKTYGIYD